jgi:hypothetical protein
MYLPRRFRNQTMTCITQGGKSDEADIDTENFFAFAQND